MNKHLFSVAAGAVAALLVATSANAVTTVTASGSGSLSYADDLVATPDSAVVIDFDGIAKAGFSFTFTAPGQIGSGNNSPVWLGIGNSAVTNPGNQFAVMKGCFTAVDCNNNVGTGLFSSVQPLKSISFLWGSPDTFNFLRYTSNGGIVTILGGGIDGPGTLVPLNGYLTPGNAERVTLNFAGDPIKSIRFGSIQNSMEIDRITAVTAAVPEPATWAMLLMGFFGLGGAIRSRRAAASAFA